MSAEFAARASGLALLCFPVAVWLGEGHIPNRFLLAILIGLVALRLLIGAFALRRTALYAGAALAAAAALACAFVPWPAALPVRYYPVAASGAIAAVFIFSSFGRRPLVERIARLSDPELPPQAVTYCRHLNWIWCAVLTLNTVLSFITTRWGSLAEWTLYNGLIAYLLIGGLWGGEFIFRRHRRRRWARA